MAGVIIQKNGHSYVYPPIVYLNSDPNHQDMNRGDKLQQFFNENGIDFDLSTGTGSAKLDIYMFTTDRYMNVERTHPIFQGTNYRMEYTTTNGNKNMAACERIRDNLRSSVMTSTLFVFKPGERSPRILFADDRGNPSFSEPIDRLNIEDFRPAKPGLLKRALHALNNSWFGDEFSKYSRDNQKFAKFRTNLEKMKTLAENEIAAHNELKQEMNHENTHSEMSAELNKQLTTINERIDAILGPVQEDVPVLLENGVYKAELFEKIPLEYGADTPFTKHEISMVAYALLSDPQIAIFRGDNQYLDPKDITSTHFCHLTHDVFFSTKGRANSDKSFKTYNPARAKAFELINAYMNGDKEPLAKAIGNAIKTQLGVVNSMGGTSALIAATNDTTCQMLEILAKDPELVAKSGLTKDDMTNAKARQIENELFKKEMQYEAEIIEAKNRGVNLSTSRKEEMVANILLAKMFKNENEKALQDRIQQPDCMQKNVELTMARAEQSKAAADLRADKEKAPEERDPSLAAKNDAAIKKVEAMTAQMDTLFSNRPVTPIMKLLGNDDANKTNRNELLAQIKKSNIFKEYASKSTAELAKIISSSSRLDNEMDTKCDNIIKEIVENKAEEKVEKAEEIILKNDAPVNENQPKEEQILNA